MLKGHLTADLSKSQDSDSALPGGSRRLEFCCIRLGIKGGENPILQELDIAHQLIKFLPVKSGPRYAHTLRTLGRARVCLQRRT